MSTVASAVEGTTFTINDTEMTILAKCESNSGYWMCTSHGETFNNNFAKDSHLGDKTGTCVLAWCCFEHGVEVP